MTWFNITEKMPADQKIHICYSEIWGVYVLAKFIPCTGWVDADGDDLKSVTDWSDVEVETPFPFRNAFDEEIGKKYGYKIKGSSSSSSYSEKLARLLGSTS